MTEKGIIGQDNHLPGKIKSEMQYFRKITLNQTVLMGSQTLMSIGQPLKNRFNIIISRNLQKYANFVSENCIISNDLTKTLQQYQSNKDHHLYVIGGAMIYQTSGPMADYLMVSIIKTAYPGNVKFPISQGTEGFKHISRTEYLEFYADVYRRKD